MFKKVRNKRFKKKNYSWRGRKIRGYKTRKFKRKGTKIRKFGSDRGGIRL